VKSARRALSPISTATKPNLTNTETFGTGVYGEVKLKYDDEIKLLDSIAATCSMIRSVIIWKAGMGGL